jgi:hypothetical protein
MNVYVIMFQIGESANTVGACATFNRALQVSREGFVSYLLTCAAIEYGPAAMEIFKAIRDRVGTDDLELRIRKPLPKDLTLNDEFWIDAHTKEGKELQPAIITITKKSLDQAKGPPMGGIQFVLEGPTTKQ